MKQFLNILTLLLYSLLCQIEAKPIKVEHVSVELVSDQTSILSGVTFTVALRMLMDEHWHTYWINPGDAGLPTKITWELPKGFTAGQIQWPTPKNFKLGEFTNYGYEDEVYLLIDITPPNNLEIGKNYFLKGKVDFLMCENICIPGSADVELRLPASNDDSNINRKWADSIEQTRKNLPVENANWKFSTFAEEGKVFLNLLPLENANEKLNEIYFFSEYPLIDPNAQQKLIKSDNGYLLELIKSDQDKKYKTLPGILYNKNGWTDDGSVVAIKISPEITNDPLPKSIVSKIADKGSGNQITATEKSLLGILIFAYIGGLILNVMPCVFPVLGLKIMGFVKQGGDEKSKIMLHGLIFTLGVLVSFWLLAGTLIILKSGGQEIGWGYHLQSPVFIFLLIQVFFIFGLNLSGLFEVGTSATSIGGNLIMRDGLSASFFTGVLATLVSTPCAAPFLSIALGAALILDPITSIVLFTFIGLGLSTPYLFFAVFPKFIQILPKPGAWMESFKQLMAFPIYATVGLLIWVLAGQINEYGLLAVFISLVLVGLSCWIYGRWSTPASKLNIRRLAVMGSIMVFSGALFIGYPENENSGIIWEEWSQEKVDQNIAEGKIVYVDFTARWCTTCLSNKATVFTSEKVIDMFLDKNIVTLKADWTNRDPKITEALAKYGRSAVPFNIIYSPNLDNPIILPEILTAGIVIETLENL